MENKIKALGLLSLIAIAAIIGGVLMAANAQTNSTPTATPTATPTTTPTPSTTTTNTNGIPIGGRMEFGGPGGFHARSGCGGFGGRFAGGFGGIQVSADFTNNVTNIAKADSNFTNLLNSGYNITSITPVIREVVDGNGNVAQQATSAIIMLSNGTTNSTTGRAIAVVDLTTMQVTKIVTDIRTVIQGT
ncbi:MAG TPA: hypothetical protein VLU95_03755 [Candidatus Acidoferrum sp.]|nr:hypothetical protein [Candidatus Acidoferrum sp.]